MPERSSLTWAAMLVYVVVPSFVACRDPGIASIQEPAIQGHTANASEVMIGCPGAEFTVIATEDDSEVAEFDMPTSTTEEATVCEIWNGADYQYKVTTVAESDANPALPAEQVVGASFSAGSLTPTTISGAAVGPSETIDPTTFAMVQATAAEQQASIDDPYYGVFSGCQPPIIQCEPSGSVTGANAMVVPGDLGGRYARHGVRRRGVRALIDRAEEVGRGIGGERRFREQRGDGEVIYAVDPQTELLVAQEFHSPREHVIARHTWVPVRRGHVRKRTDVEFTEIRDGKTLRSRTTIDVRDLTIGGVPVQ